MTEAMIPYRVAGCGDLFQNVRALVNLLAQAEEGGRNRVSGT
jgi:hypothetical protein